MKRNVCKVWHTAQRRCAEVIFLDPVIITLISLSNLSFITMASGYIQPVSGLLSGVSRISGARRKPYRRALSYTRCT